MAGDGLGDLIIGGVESVTAKWAKQRKAEERHASAVRNRRDAMTRIRPVTIKDAAWQVMEAAYLKASANGTLPANARQIMYAGRPDILAMTGKSDLDSAYFTQTLLPDYLAACGLEDAWDVVYDGRGHFTEPHSGFRESRAVSIPLSTLAVRSYPPKAAKPMEIGKLHLDYPTAGPQNRYGGVLFIEKEGFLPLLAQAQTAAKYDLAIMSTKGMSVVAARRLVDRLCSIGQTRLFIVRDFDKPGFSIAATLIRSARRYRFRNMIDAVDLGLRLEDVEAYSLEAEPVYYQAADWKIEQNLRGNGATSDEIAFLLDQRVELNAFASDQFIEWLEAKLEENGAEKVIPGAETLETAWRRARMRLAVNKKISEIQASLRGDANAETVPGDLAAQVRERLDDDPAMSWDEALAAIAEDGDGAP
jgi:Protein of unknown function C-terminus (DUF2399)